jgi:hypothetical protein
MAIDKQDRGAIIALFNNMRVPDFLVKGAGCGHGFQFQSIVTPVKAGVHHRLLKFQHGVMDSRLRGNDEKRQEGIF